MRKLLTLFTFIFMTTGTYAQSVVINNKWLEYDVTQNGVKGMKIHVDFNVKNMKGKQGKVIVYFEHPKGTGLEDTNGNYRTKDGDVCVSKNFTPRYDNSHYSDFDIFMPIDEIHMKKGKLTYYCDIRIQDSSSGKFLNGETYLSFTGTSQGEDVSNQYANNSNRNSNPGRRWREDAGYGMFYDCQEMNGGIVSKTLYATCMACRGSSACGNCHGTATCAICRGRGGITTAGYGRFIPCTACSQSGRCRVCKGSGRCVCSSSDFPGYVAGANTLYAADGRILSTNSFRVGDDSSDSSEPSHSSSSSSSRGSCSNCGGTGVDPTPGGGLASWAAYYNSEGSKCPYCGRYTSHMHDKCASCNVPRY